MNISNQVQQLDTMVKQGAIVDAANAFFAETINTSDYKQLTTTGKDQTIEKLEGFVGSIAKVNGITHHRTITDSNLSASEFTFDFDMKDGSKILWHEIIRRVWNEEGKVVAEAYFKA